MITEGHFDNPTLGKISFSGVIDAIVDYMADQPEAEYSVVVGCDSSSDREPLFPVAIVILRKGQGGRFFLKKIRYKDSAKFKNWKMRILEEVVLSCELALMLRESLEDRVLNLDEVVDYEFRYIHADVGKSGATRSMVREVTGLIRGNGFEPMIKPEAYVASGVADKFC